VARPGGRRQRVAVRDQVSAGPECARHHVPGCHPRTDAHPLGLTRLPNGVRGNRPLTCVLRDVSVAPSGCDMVIGWRPYLLTVIALAIVAVACLDQLAPASAGSSCSRQHSQLQAGLVDTALSGYVATETADPQSKCAAAGVVTAQRKLCARAVELAASDLVDARSQLATLARSDPTPRSRSCVWSDLKRLQESK
jgi:hypothetical protein